MSQAAASAPASRAGAKLEAALASFALAPRVAGARALDVGAGAGGFTEALLAHGAASVTAVDVGHGQLRAQLRADPRVEALEGLDFRRMPLRVAPGPFDFFAVDVSFAAGRNVMRGLAFRLRAGAEGVVLVKPQFELPPRVLASGAADPARLRALAVERLVGKAGKLGFRLLEVRDSPVAGRAGTVEVLAHLRFEGRPALVPAPGGARPRPAPAPLAQAPDGLVDWFAVVTPGGEAAAAQEIAELGGAESVSALPGGVEFRGDMALGARANLWLRLP